MVDDYSETLNWPIAAMLQGNETPTPTTQDLANVSQPSAWKILVHLTVANINKAGVNRRLLKEDGEGRNVLRQTVHQTFILGYEW